MDDYSTTRQSRMTENDRQWKLLDEMDNKLDRISSKLSKIDRLEEKVDAVRSTQLKHESLIQDHEQRLRHCEVTHAECAATIQNTLQNNMTDEILDEHSKNLRTLKERADKEDGEKEIRNRVLKWVLGIVASIFVFKLTKG